jgi:DNA-binding Lrp family transcriptional regulator
MSEHFYAVANKRIAELQANGESQVRIARRWGLSQNTVNKIMQRSGGLGVKALVGMRLDLRMSIDEILGLPPFDDGPRSEMRPK